MTDKKPGDVADFKLTVSGSASSLPKAGPPSFARMSALRVDVVTNDKVNVCSVKSDSSPTEVSVSSLRAFLLRKWGL